MRLWRATVEVEVFIAADDEPDSYDIADAAEESMRDGGVDTCWPPEEVTDISDVPAEWRASIPYGDADDQTCEYILGATPAQIEAKETARLAKAYNSPLPNQMPLPLPESD